MLTEDGPFLIEYNVRLGDPEAQALLPRLQSDLLTALLAACDGGLSHVSLQWLDVACVSVVLAAGGYPGATTPGAPVTGLEQAAQVPHAAIFQAGTDVRGGHVVATGGRVLSVCGTGATVEGARAAAYAAIAEIGLPGGQFRTDIGKKAVLF